MSKNFVVEDFETISFNSIWQTNRTSQDNACQTPNMNFSDSGTQSHSKNSIEVQTVSNQMQSQDVSDLSKLGAWLTKVTPLVLKELEKGRKSHAFDEYRLQETQESITRVLMTLKVEENLSQFTSAVDWSSSGGTIAVARCVREHPNWCDHSGIVTLHHTNKKEPKNDAAYCILNAGSCVTVLSAHPSDSFILACGTFSGEVTVWNLQKDEAVIIGSVTLHSEAVAHLEWIPKFGAMHMRPVLASASRDGSVILWTMKSTSGTLKADQFFLLQSEKENIDQGIVCAKFNPCSPYLFLGGIEGGHLVVCSTEKKTPCRRKRAHPSQETAWYDPVVSTLEGHKGTITGVQWVPGSTDLFLSCGTDSELHVYSLAELHLSRVVFLPEPSSGLQVCASHPNLAVTWGSSGAVHLHDIHTSQKLPSLDLATEEEKALPLSVVRIRNASSPLFAVGDVCGRVLVLRVPSTKLSGSVDAEL